MKFIPLGCDVMKAILLVFMIDIVHVFLTRVPVFDFTQYHRNTLHTWIIQGEEWTHMKGQSYVLALMSLWLLKITARYDKILSICKVKVDYCKAEAILYSVSESFTYNEMDIFISMVF
mgnify:FL=1